MSLIKTLKIFAIALAITSIPAAVFAVPQFPHIFYGDITINDSSAPVGTVVIAKVNGVEKGRATTTETGAYGGPGAYDQKLLVQGSDLVLGNTISFTVSGFAAPQTASFESGKLEKLDLSFTISQVEVTPSGLAGLLDNGTISVSGSAENASSTTFTQIVKINIVADGGTSTVILPQNTIITKTGGGTFNANNLTANFVASSSLSGLGTGVVVNGALQWGLANLGLEFSSPISISIFVGTAFNGQTLNVQRSTTGNSGWTNDGIVSPATCVVSSGLCTFGATKASYFVASHTVVTPTPTPSPSSSPSGGEETTTPPPTYKTGDANKDGKVDKYDFALLMANWGKIGTNNSDLNNDGKVDKYDFAMLMANWTI